MRRRVATWIGVALLATLGACAQAPGAPRVEGLDAPAAASSERPGDGAPDDTRRVWFDVLAVSQEAPSTRLIELADGPARLGELWAGYRMAGAPPQVDFTQHVVVFYARAEDACPDELVALTWQGSVLEATWVPPPGACNEPLIATGYAVQLHRADLGTAPTFALRQDPAYDGDLQRTFELPTYDGPEAPAPPPVHQQPPETEIAALFDASPLQRCSDVADPSDQPAEVNGPLSDDPQVAAAQQGRAAHGLASDEATTRQVLADPANSQRGFDFPLTQNELDSFWERQNTDIGSALQAYGAEYPDTFGFLFISQSRGGQWTLGFTADLETHRQRLAERFPEANIAVLDTPFTYEELERAAAPLRDAMPGELGLSHLAVGLTRVNAGVIDPTPDTLDRIASLTDPAKVCIEPQFSGAPPPSG